MTKPITEDVLEEVLEKAISLLEFSGGGLFYKVKNRKKKKGERFGCQVKSGYIYGGIAGFHVSEHRLVWAMHKGALPDAIDHINGIRNDNRLENLREANQSENLQNKAVQTNNKSGFTGVSFVPQRNKWQAHIQWSGKQKNLGRFDTIQEAAAAYKAAKEALHTFHPDVVDRPAIYES